MQTWYKQFKLKQAAVDRRIAIAAAVATLTDLAKQIQILADDVNMSKSQYLKDSSNAVLWENPQNVSNINKTLNQCWQSVVSAVRSLQMGNNVFEAGNAIGTAKKFLQQVCGLVDCNNKALSRISNALSSAWNKISTFAEQPVQQKPKPQVQPQVAPQQAMQPQQPQQQAA